MFLQNIHFEQNESIIKCLHKQEHLIKNRLKNSHIVLYATVNQHINLRYLDPFHIKNKINKNVYTNPIKSLSISVMFETDKPSTTFLKIEMV